MVAIGTLAVVVPDVVAEALTLLPGLDSFPGLLPLRQWGLVYVVLGGFVEWHLRRVRRVGPRRTGAAAFGAAVALFGGHLATTTGFDAAVELFSWSVAVVVPFVAGAPRRIAGRYAALGLLAIPIVATRLALEPVAFEYVVSPLVQATYLSLVGATFGLPLFALGGVGASDAMEKEID